MLRQAEADNLIMMRKRFMAPAPTVSLPPSTDQIHELVSEDAREMFFLDLWRGTFRLSKLKFQNRGRKVIVLVRLDIKGSPHTNPDGTELNGTHLHIYREGYEDKWAYPIEPSSFRNVNSIKECFDDFCNYCNIEIPPYQGGLI
jgi:hypothetical protein